MNEKTILLGKGDVTTDQILDQKEAANDLSDYLFYMTRLFYDIYSLLLFRYIIINIIGDLFGFLFIYFIAWILKKMIQFGVTI